jgi:hypothetical protein
MYYMMKSIRRIFWYIHKGKLTNFFTMYYEMAIKNVWRLIAATRNRYGARQLNEQNIFLSMFGLVLGTVYGARRIMNDRNLIKFPAVQVSNLTFWMYVVSSHPDMTVVL